MENFEIFITSFFGKSTDNSKWTGICNIAPTHSGIRKYGRVFGIVSLAAPVGFDSRTIGDFLQETIEDVFYEEDEDESTVTRLEKTILATAKRLEYMIEREKTSMQGIDLNIVLMSLKENFVYMAILGDGRVMLSRGDLLIDLGEGMKDLSGRNLIKSGSGLCQLGDIFILLTPEATVKLNEIELKRMIKNEDPSFVIEKNNPLFGNMMIFLKEEKEQVEKKEGNIIPISADIEEEKEISDIAEEETKQEPFKQNFEEDDEFYKKEEKKELNSLDKQIQKEKEEYESPVKHTEDGEKNESNLVSGKSGSGKFSKVKESKAFNAAKNVSSKIKGKISDKKTYEVLISKTKVYSQKVFLFTKKYIWEGLLGMKPGTMFLKGGRGKRPIRGIVIILAVVLLLLYFSVKGIKRNSETNENIDNVKAQIASVEDALKGAKNMGESGDIAGAVAKLDEVIATMESQKQYGVELDVINSKITEATDLKDEVSRTIRVTDSDLITDVSAYISGADAKDIEYRDGKLYILDKTNAALYVMKTESNEVSTIIAANTKLAQPVSLTFNADGELIIADLSKGMLRVKLEDGSTESLVGLSAASIGAITDLADYKMPDNADNLYALRSEKTDVIKIVKYASGYGLPTVRLKDPSYADGSDIEIDGKIYVLSNGEGIVRYLAEKRDPYTLVGVDKNLNNPTSFELDDTLVYIGDSGNGRVLVVTKGFPQSDQQGTYICQLVYRGGKSAVFTDIREITIDESGKKAYILDGKTIYKVDLTKVKEYEETLKNK